MHLSLFSPTRNEAKASGQQKKSSLQKSIRDLAIVRSPSVVEEDDCVVVSSGVSEVALQTKSGHTKSSTVGAQAL